jgi:hypothetical protein
MTPEVELLDALRSGQADVTRTGAWLDLFLQLAQPRIEKLQRTIDAWAQQPDSALQFVALSLVDELAGICSEQNAASLYQLSSALANALRHASAENASNLKRQAIATSLDELLRQLHQHAAGVKVVTPPHILAQLQN